ncbi:MAG: hypothetical protein VW550_13085, partial [Thalassospira sp.]
LGLFGKGRNTATHRTVFGLRPQSGKFSDVMTRAVVWACSLQQDTMHICICICTVHRICQCIKHCTVKGVAFIGTINADRADVIANF